MSIDTTQQAPLLQCGWFVFGTVSQVLIIHIIRSGKVPFVQNLATKPLFVSTTMVALSALLVGFSSLVLRLDMATLPFRFLSWLILLLAGYYVSTQLCRQFCTRHFGEWL